MPHPFFQVPTYPWHRQDARDLYLALWQTIQQPGRIDLFYQSSGADLIPLVPGSADQIWKDALQKLAAAARLKTLCDLLLADPSIAAIHPTVIAVQNAQDIFEQTLLGDDRVFVDRLELRLKLQRLATSSSFPVLLIRGSADSGKSWTQYMVSAVAREMGQPSVYLFEGLVSTVDEVLDHLFTALGNAAAVPARMETEDAWFKKVCLKLFELGKISGKTSWVVIDDLGVDEQGPRLDPLIRKFFDQFVLSLANPAFAEWFRLVLIDYPDLTAETGGRGVPTRWRDIWDEDRPDVAHVNADALAGFVTQWAQRKNKQLDATGAQNFATDLLAAVDAAVLAANPARPRLQTIHDELVIKLEKL